MGTAVTILILTIMKKINDYINIGTNNDDKIKNNMNGNTTDNNDRNIVKKTASGCPSPYYGICTDQAYRSSIQNIKNYKTDNLIQ